MALVHAGRQYELDFLRGFAALMVVGFHYFYKGPLEGWVSFRLGPDVERVSAYGYLGVHLFFMISGYVIMISAQSGDLRGFIASRLARLAPALWVCATATALIELAVPEAPFQPKSWAQYLANLTMVPGLFGQETLDGAYWSLAVEINFYCLVSVGLALRQLRHVEWWFIGWLGVSLVNLIRPMYPLQMAASVQWAPFFCAGAYFSFVMVSGWTLRRVLVIGASLLLSCMYAWQEAEGTVGRLGAPMDFPVVNPWVVLIAVIVFYALFTALMFRRVPLGYSWLGDLCGRLTYPLYLIHQNAGYAIFALAASLGWVSSVGASWLACCVVLLALCCAWLVNAFIESRLGPFIRRLVVAGWR